MFYITYTIKIQPIFMSIHSARCEIFAHQLIVKHSIYGKEHILMVLI